MSDIIDLHRERAKREPQPDRAHVFTDEEGVTWHEFTCEYGDIDGSFAFSIWAKDAADAERRLNVLRATAMVKGPLYSTIPG